MINSLESRLLGQVKENLNFVSSCVAHFGWGDAEDEFLRRSVFLCVSADLLLDLSSRWECEERLLLLLLLLRSLPRLRVRLRLFLLPLRPRELRLRLRLRLWLRLWLRLRLRDLEWLEPDDADDERRRLSAERLREEEYLLLLLCGDRLCCFRLVSSPCRSRFETERDRLRPSLEVDRRRERSRGAGRPRAGEGDLDLKDGERRLGRLSSSRLSSREGPGRPREANEPPRCDLWSCRLTGDRERRGPCP